MKTLLLSLLLVISTLGFAEAQAAPSGTVTVAVTSPPVTPGFTAYNVWRRTSPGVTPGLNPTYALLGTITLPANSLVIPPGTLAVGTHYLSLSALYGPSVESAKSGENPAIIPPGPPVAFTVTVTP